MAIYGRWGDEVTVLRRAVLADVRRLDGRTPDKQDRQAVAAGSYVVVRRGDGKEALYHLSYLRADDGLREIMAALDAH